VAYSNELCAPSPEIIEANVLFKSESKAKVLLRNVIFLQLEAFDENHP